MQSGHLHRVVRSWTGQSPSTLVRVVRLHRLVALAATERLPVPGRRRDLLGYADHPHLCHETRLLAGRTPTELFGRTSTIRGDLTTSLAATGHRTVVVVRMTTVLHRRQGDEEQSCLNPRRSCAMPATWSSRTIPSRDIPDALTRAGLTVTIYGGPAEADVVLSELSDGAIVHRQVGRYPDQADLLYTYRPLAEIDAHRQRGASSGSQHSLAPARSRRRRRSMPKPGGHMSRRPGLPTWTHRRSMRWPGRSRSRPIGARMVT